jgi:hypothetical protein
MESSSASWERYQCRQLLWPFGDGGLVPGSRPRRFLHEPRRDQAEAGTEDGHDGDPAEDV